MKLFIYLSALCLSILLATIIFFYHPNILKINEVEKTKPIKANFSINFSTEKLPFNFKGDDIDDLFNNLSKYQPRGKDAYETIDDYNNRAIPLLQQLSDKNNLYCLQFTENAMSLRNMKYNIDNESYEFTINLSPTHFYLSELDIGERSISTGSYTAQNAFGANIAVETKDQSYFKLLIVNENEIVNSVQEYIKNHNINNKLIDHSDFYYFLKRKGLQNGFINVKIPVQRQKAREYDIKVIAIIKPKPYKMQNGLYQLIYINKTRLEPKFNQAYDIQIYSYGIFAELLGIWVYDFKSGEILAKFMPPIFISSNDADSLFKKKEDNFDRGGGWQGSHSGSHGGGVKSFSISMRNKYGKENINVNGNIFIKVPSGKEYKAKILIKGAEWNDVKFPNKFNAPIDELKQGIYSWRCVVKGETVFNASLELIIDPNGETNVKWHE